jgi:hypothetical protein
MRHAATSEINRSPGKKEANKQQTVVCRPIECPERTCESALFGSHLPQLLFARVELLQVLSC